MKAIKKTLSFFNSIIIAAVLSLLISIFLFQPTEVLGSSMEPTLQDKERIYLSKLPHTFNYNPDYGDIVVIDSRVDRKRSLKDDLLESPLVNLITNKNHRGNNHDFWIKRVIGKPGDILEFKNHNVYRNDELINETYIKEPMITSNQKIIVPPNHIFVLGDNRNNSKDSRLIGSIPMDHVLGKMLFNN